MRNRITPLLIVWRPSHRRNNCSLSSFVTTAVGKRAQPDYQIRGHKEVKELQAADKCMKWLGRIGVWSAGWQNGQCCHVGFSVDAQRLLCGTNCFAVSPFWNWIQLAAVCVNDRQMQQILRLQMAAEDVVVHDLVTCSVREIERYLMSRTRIPETADVTCTSAFCLSGNLLSTF